MFSSLMGENWDWGGVGGVGATHVGRASHLGSEKPAHRRMARARAGRWACARPFPNWREGRQARGRTLGGRRRPTHADGRESITHGADSQIQGHPISWLWVSHQQAEPAAIMYHLSDLTMINKLFMIES